MKPFRSSLVLTLSAFALSLASPVAANAKTTAPKVVPPAQCIVSLSPTATNTLFAIGAGPQVEAVDESSTYPAAAAALAQRHVINGLAPSLEGLLGICATSAKHPSTKPDLVILSYNPNNLAAQLTAQGVTVVEQDAPNDVQGALNQILQLGTLTGHVAKATAIANAMRTQITAAEASILPHAGAPISVYYEVSTNPYYSLTSNTFVGSVMKAMGLVNIADAVATSADYGYPELSAEYIIHASPSIIFLAGDDTRTNLSKRSGFGGISAVKTRDVVVLNADVASQWGPRFATLVKAIAAEVNRYIANN